MSLRLTVYAVLLATALGCGGTAQLSEPAAQGGGSDGGRASVAGSRAGNDESAVLAGAGHGGSEAHEEHAGGGAGEAGGAGEGGAPSEPLWNDDTQRIELECFGFFAGFATFRADRAQLSEAQIASLEELHGVPGDTYDDNDDRIHCVVTQTNGARELRKLIPNDLRGLVTSEQQQDGYRHTVLGCEFRHPYLFDQSVPLALALPANPLCVVELWGSRCNLDMSKVGTTYRVELVHCAGKPNLPKLELFGEDPDTAVAVATPPSSPGPDRTCLVLEAQVAAPSVGRIVFSFGSDYQLRFY